MLKYLHIENIAVIEKSEIEFSDGFTVLTGETGAGKSIVIDALNAVLGERTSKELIRSGCEKAEVSALFSELSDNTLELLNENGYETDDSGELLIRRVLSNSSNGSVRINGKAATVGILKEIASSLVDIHGQHDNRNLLDEQQHCNYIDLLADNSLLREEYYKSFKRLNSLRRELAALETDEEEKQRKTELLNFQINELQSADIKIGESEELKKKLLVAENFEKNVKALNGVLSALRGDDESEGAKGLLTYAKRDLLTVSDDKLLSNVAKLETIGFELDAICADINEFIDANDYDASEISKIRDRLDFLYRLMLKYGDSEQKMLLFLENAEKELEAITFSEEREQQLSLELDEATEELVLLGEKLTSSRKQVAQLFEKNVCEGLCQLDMPNVKFSVLFNKGRYTKNGCDEVSFLISANTGEEPRPLSKVASGGELSRIMLVIKKCLAHKDAVPTLIFDEIDTGISGNAAVKGGEMLATVAIERQVICVTHLAQIAAAAKNHLLIKKHSDEERTYTNVSPLSGDEVISELARIMAGGELTENIIKSAKELLDRSKRK